MVKVIFFNLLRSKYNIHQIEVMSGSIHEILSQIQVLYPKVELKDFENSVVFINSNKIVHQSKFNELVKDGDEVVFTHFVGGG